MNNGKKVNISKWDVAADKAVEYILSNYVHGEVVTHAVLEKLSGIHDQKSAIPVVFTTPSVIGYGDLREKEGKKKSNDHRYFVDRVQKILLLHHKIALVNVFAEGYKLLLPKEHVTHAADMLSKHIEAKVIKYSNIVKNTNVDMLNAADKEIHKGRSKVFERSVKDIMSSMGKLKAGMEELQEIRTQKKGSTSIHKRLTKQKEKIA